MMPPASRDGHQIVTATGNIEKATAALPESTACSRASVPRAPPTKSIRLSVRMSPMFEQLSRGRVSEAAPRRGHWRASPPSALAPLEIDGVPLPLEVHGDLAAARRDRAAFLDRETIAKRAQELGRGAAASEILDGAVVGLDLNLVVGKRDRDEQARLGRVARPSAKLLAGPRRAGHAVVAVGDVERRNLPKCSDQGRGVFRARAPRSCAAHRLLP